MSIRWLLEAFTSLQQEGHNLQIVPVVTSYDRILEHHNLANEMIEGERVDYSFLESFQEIAKTETD